MPLIAEFALNGRDNKRIRVYLACGAAFILLFTSYLVKLIRAVTISPQPAEIRVFGEFMIGFVVLLIVIVAWKSFLLAIHVSGATATGSEVLLTRVFGPAMSVSESSAFPSFVSTVPAFDAPYFKRGTVFRRGVSLFYISDYLPNSGLLIEFLTEGQRS